MEVQRMDRYIVMTEQDAKAWTPSVRSELTRLPLINGYSALMTPEEVQDAVAKGGIVSKENRYTIPTPVEAPYSASHTYPTQELDPSNIGTMNMMEVSGVEELIDLGYVGTDVTIGIVDSGVDAEHPDLVGRISKFVDLVDDDQTPKDPCGHGTAVSSVAAGNGFLVEKFHGVAINANVAVARVMDSSGSGGESNIIAGLQWMSQMGVKIINLSLGSMLRRWTPLSQAVQNLADTGHIVTIAAGNSGPNTITSPANAYGAITVAACDQNDEPAAFSSRGPAMGRDREDVIKPDVMAWGKNIPAARSSDMSVGMGTRIHDRYVAINGTSFSAPFVAGCAAIYMEAIGDISSFRDDVAATAHDDPGLDEFIEGNGSIRILQAIKRRLGDVPPIEYPKKGGCLLAIPALIANVFQGGM
jgi:subtilisin family serine protease